MAYMGRRQFDSLRVAKQRKYGNWPLLNRSWLPLVEWLGERWWGSVSKEQLVSSLNRPEVTVGAIAITAYFGDMQGGVCSCMVKSTDNTLIPFDIHVTQGYYKCTEFLDWDRGDPVQLITDVLKAVPSGYLMARPRDIPDEQNNWSGKCVVEGMREMIQLLEGAWWGHSTGSSPMSSNHIEVIQDLKKMEDEYPKPAAAICYMDEEEYGYLFEIVTAKGQPYKVTFDKSGFVLDTDIHFNSMTSLLDHMTTVVKVSFVPRPLSTTQDLCMSKMDVTGGRRRGPVESSGGLPSLKRSIQTSPYDQRYRP
jgi:hypothetical protein